MNTETIAAIATALSNSGIGIIRISGDKAFEIIDKIYKSKSGNKKISNQPSHTIHYGFIYDDEVMIDEVMVVKMDGPNTYTREDTIEIDCHGGIIVTQKILQTVIKYGARCATPGEFTKRAYLNGRIDLSQAEAVMDIINSKNNYALKASVAQLKGNVKEKIADVRNVIIHDIAFVEAALDDPEHIDIGDYKSTILKNANESIRILQKMYDSADNGRIIKEGIDTVIVGKPNAGKSSLLNALVGEERAIVTDIAGTTRDIINEVININGITLNVIDTAGIRDTEDTVEKIGINKAKEYANKADLVIFVVDGSTPLDENDFEIAEIIKDKKAIILLNKMDLEGVTSTSDIEKISDKKIIPVSAKNQVGISDFEECLKEMFYQNIIEYNDEVVITNERHKDGISRAMESLSLVIESIENGFSEDLYAVDMMDAYESLGQIIGESVEDDLVDTIFREFCMGK